ncbi:MAG TPA: hypothetical protein VF708_11160 [Pyrinomonadaceae bacterium]|jgi:F420-0:gamma-glutamyl ligase
MQSNQSATLKVLNSPCEDERIEVVIEDQGGVVLRHSTWTEGLGWCGQKTIRLDSDQIDDLHRALTVARHRLNRQRAEAGQFKESARIIHLPTLA